MDDMFRQLIKVAEGTIVGADSSSVTTQTSHLATDDEDAFAYDELVYPSIKPQKAEDGMRTVLVVDDDFTTIDLMKIYLQREYKYVSFDNPKDAIFWLNNNVPDLIFLDCYMTMISTRRVIEIIKTYKELKDVPIYYLSESDEVGAVSGKLPEGVHGVISRPVSRGDLHKVLDEVFNAKEEDGEGAPEEATEEAQ